MSTSNVISILIIRTNYDSSIKVRVLSQWEGGCGGMLGQLVSDWSKFKMADGKQSSDWTIIQDG